VVLNEDKRGLKIGRVELVWDTEAERSELSALIDDRVHEAESEDRLSPVLVRLDLLKEVLSDESVVSSSHTSGNTLGRLSSNLDGHLEKTKREILVRLTSDPKTEGLVDLLVLRVKDVFHHCHEHKTKMAIVENNPETVTHGVIDVFLGNDLLLFSHGDLGSSDSLLSSQLINSVGGI